MTEAWQAEVAIGTASEVGEGPLWDAERQRLIWIDIPRGVVHAGDGDAVTSVELGEPVGFVVRRRRGGYIAGTASGIVALDSSLRPTAAIAVPPDFDGVRRCNDGTCDSAGRVLFGSVDPASQVTGTLWSIDEHGDFTALVDGVRMSNGVGFSPDGLRLYYVDSLARTVEAFTYDPASGAVGNRQSFFEVPADVGLPDGLAVDECGDVWLAVWGPGQVWRLSPDGERTGIVHVPASRTTSCAFDGAGRLFVTTARAGRSELDALDTETAPGAVFAAHVARRGRGAWDAAL